MANTGSASVTLRGRFPIGAKVGLYPRTGDFFRGGTAIASQTVSKDGTASFTGLEEGARFWVAADIDGTVRSAAVTAKVQPGAAKVVTAKEIRERLHSTRPVQGVVMVSGPRSTTSMRPAVKSVGEPTPADEREAEPLPHLRQEDARNVPQRSATLTGMATPKDPDEIVPAPSQQDIPRDTPQRSATEFGIATPKQIDEEAGGAKQEAARDIDQRSATELGVAEPKPTGDAVEQERAKYSAMSKARGGRQAERATAKSPVKAEKAPVKRQPARKPARKPSSKSAAAKPAAKKSTTTKKER